jgi:hypothetical protein
VGPYFSHETPLENQLTLSNVVTYLRWFGVVLCQIFVVVTIETFDFGHVSLCLFNRWLFVH